MIRDQDGNLRIKHGNNLQKFIITQGSKIIYWLYERRRFGALRFRLSRKILSFMSKWSYFPNSRNERYEFIFKYLPKLKMVYYYGLPTLDIGCVDSLLIYELADRNYVSCGLDIRDYPVELPKPMKFFKCDITEPLPEDLKKMKFQYIIATSVIEVIGIGKYKGQENNHADRLALENIHSLLSPEGYFILTLPVWNWKFRDGKGYLLGDIHNLIDGLFRIFEITQTGGQICMALVKIVNGDSIGCMNKKFEIKEKVYD